MSITSTPTPSWATSTGLLALQGVDRTSTPEQALDKALCAETVHRFAFAYDEQNRDALIDCFTADAVLHATTAGTHDFGTYRGRDDVVGWLTAYWGATQDQRRHIVANAMVDDLTGNTARVSTMLVVTAAQDGAFRAVTAGVYRADLRRDHDGAWRIFAFELGFDAAF